jgi:general secretion pathway protein F
MAVYQYKGIDHKGKEVTATITAETEVAAKQRLKSMSIMLISLKEKKTGQASSKSSLNVSLFKKKISITELALMTRQFATLVKAKIQIVEALNALSNQVDSEELKVVLNDIKTKVNEGTSLAKALGQHKDIFDTVYVNMVEAGEASGTLDIVLVRLAEFKESQMKLKNKVQGAMTYPMLMGIVGTVVLGVVFIFVVPQFAKMLQGQKRKLPAITEYTLAISNFLQNYWWLTIIMVIASVILFKNYIKTENGKRRWDKFILNAPIFGDIVKMINVGRFCSTMSTLLSSSVPILAAMSIVKNLMPNVWLQDAVEKSRTMVSEGGSMTPPLIESGYFPTMVTHMIKLGEQSGELESMLGIIAENYKDEVEQKMSGLTSLLEPVMIIVMAVIVGIVVMAVLVPMMEMMNIRR